MNRRQFILSSGACALLNSSSASGASVDVVRVSDEQSKLSEIAKDPLRPRYHILPEAGFVGDPCAPCFFNGRYHVFFHGSYGGRGWQHAMSSDLLHWQHMPIALAPTDGGDDSYGTFTGGFMPGGDGVSVVYTGVTKVPRDQETIRAEGLKETQCIATSTDSDLRTFHKWPSPVILAPPEGTQVTGFRDPFGWKQGDIWYMGVGSGFPQIGGAILLYRSKDMRHWEYIHPLAQGTWNGQSFSNPVPSGEMWECPDFFPLGDRQVLIYSTEHSTFWEIGVFDQVELRFHAESSGVLDHGAYYAPRSMADGSNRRILWGWIQETRSREETLKAGWSGCISLPRILTLSEDRRLQIDVAPEVQKLRQTDVSNKDFTPQAPETSINLGTVSGRAGEIICTFRASSGPCGLELVAAGTADGEVLVKIAFFYANGKPMAAIGDRLIPLTPALDQLSTVRVWLDCSVIETLLDRRHAITSRCYGSTNRAGEISAVWSGSLGQLKEHSVFQLQPISTL